MQISDIEEAKQLLYQNPEILKQMVESDEEQLTPEGRATVGGFFKQLAIGAANSALLDIPLWLAGEEKAQELEGTGIERFGRGVGTTAGFLLGLPKQVFKLVGPIGSRLGAKLATGVGARGLKRRLIASAVTRGTELGAFELATAPQPGRDITDKVFTIPLSVTLGGALGLASPVVKPLVRKFSGELTNLINKGGGTEEFKKIMQSFANESNELRLKTNQAVKSFMDSKEFKKANDFILNNFSGAKAKLARDKLKNAHLEFVKTHPKYKSFLDGDYIDKIRAQIERIAPPGHFTRPLYRKLKAMRHSKINELTTGDRVYLKYGGFKSTGREFIRLYDLARNKGEEYAGTVVTNIEMMSQSLNSLEKNNLRRLLQGKINHPYNNKVKEIFSAFRGYYNDVADKGTAFNIKGFNRKKDYFPQFVLNPDSPRSKVKESILEGIRNKIFRNEAEGWKLWDAWKATQTPEIKSFKARKSYIDFMKKQGWANSDQEAESKLVDFWHIEKTTRFGNLSHQRIMDLPFYELDPVDASIRYFDGAYKSIAQHEVLGENGIGKLAELKLKAATPVFDPKTKAIIRSPELNHHQIHHLEELMKRLTGVTAMEDAFGVINPAQSQAIRAFQVITKLGLSPIANASQPLLTFISRSAKAFGAGLKEMLKKDTRETAYRRAGRAGVILESTINDYLSGSGATGNLRILGKKFSAQSFLKKIGFTPIERFNRVLDANVAYYQVKFSTQDLLKEQAKGKTMQALSRTSHWKMLRKLGLNPAKIIKNNGILSQEDFVKAMQTSIPATQFRAGPLDLPLLFTSPEGKIIGQFKTFAFNAARFWKNEILGEMRRGNFAPISKALLLMPIIGEGIKDVRSIITGQKRDEKGMERLAENFAAVGAAGMMTDIIQAAKYNNMASLIGGPTVSDIAKTTTGAVKATQGKPQMLGRHLTRNIPVAGPRLAGSLFPTKTQLRSRRERDNRIGAILARYR